MNKGIAVGDLGNGSDESDSEDDEFDDDDDDDAEKSRVRKKARGGGYILVAGAPFLHNRLQKKNKKKIADSKRAFATNNPTLTRTLCSRGGGGG